MFTRDSIHVDAVIPARWYGEPRTAIDVICLHDMESPEAAETAETVSRWAQTLPSDRKASWTYAVDTNSIVQCVPELVVAYAAPGANHDGIQIEHAGRARQTRAEWLDAYSRPMLELSALLSADICRRRGLPPVWLSPADLQAGRRGITSHANVSLAFGKSTHTDPGAGFPADWYLQQVNLHLTRRDRPTWADYLQLWVTPAGGQTTKYIGWDRAWPAVGWVARNGLRPGTAASIAWRNPGPDRRVERDPQDVVSVCRALVALHQKGQLQ